ECMHGGNTNLVLQLNVSHKMNTKYRTIANTGRDSYKRCSTSTNFTTAETPTTKAQKIIPAGHLFLLCWPWVLHQGLGALRKGRLSRTRTVNYYSVNVRRTITGSSYAVTLHPACQEDYHRQKFLPPLAVL
ncbi:hypothetical protein PIB30_101571, partial [Stylosanthes scabra]|nr:hypothetical protein [Stylosanthes scabra]